MLLKPTTFRLHLGACVFMSVFVHQCLCVQLCVRVWGGGKGRAGSPSVLIFIVSSCCSIWRFSWPMHICPSFTPSCDSNVVPWKHASAHSLADKKIKRKKKIINPLRADSLGILPPILLWLFARLWHPGCDRTVTLLTKSFSWALACWDYRFSQEATHKWGEIREQQQGDVRCQASVLGNSHIHLYVIV